MANEPRNSPRRLRGHREEGRLGLRAYRQVAEVAGDGPESVHPCLLGVLRASVVRKYAKRSQLGGEGSFKFEVWSLKFEVGGAKRLNWGEYAKQSQCLDTWNGVKQRPNKELWGKRASRNFRKTKPIGFVWSFKRQAISEASEGSGLPASHFRLHTLPHTAFRRHYERGGLFLTRPAWAW